jgi:hypothetical protein
MLALLTLAYTEKSRHTHTHARAQLGSMNRSFVSSIFGHKARMFMRENEKSFSDVRSLESNYLRCLIAYGLMGSCRRALSLVSKN